MQTTIGYRRIIQLALPIILGGVAQTIIMATDAFFMARVDEVSLAAVGLAGLFFSSVYVFGLGFSVGVQILIARRDGEKNHSAIGSIFDNSLLILFLMSLVLWLGLEVFGPALLKSLVSSEAVYEASVSYLGSRSWGITFALISLAFRSLFIGISQSAVITWSTFSMAIANVFLNYALIFGEFGFDEMGIRGAGIASSLSEIVAIIWFVAHAFITKAINKYGLFRWKGISRDEISSVFSISAPVMFQNVISHGGWFLFFIIIEKNSERALAISVIIRMIYMFQMVPFWGLTSAANTLVSYIIGEGRNQEVFPLLRKITWLAIISATPFLVANLFFPQFVLGLAVEDKTSTLLTEAVPTLYVVSLGLLLFAIASAVFAGVTGSGNTRTALAIEIITILFYLVIAWFLGIYLKLDVALVWLTEPIYFVLMGLMAFAYLRTGKWQNRKI
jgi:putative MATE family efflux protein